MCIPPVWEPQLSGWAQAASALEPWNCAAADATRAVCSPALRHSCCQPCAVPANRDKPLLRPPSLPSLARRSSQCRPPPSRPAAAAAARRARSPCQLFARPGWPAGLGLHGDPAARPGLRLLPQAQQPRWVLQRALLLQGQAMETLHGDAWLHASSQLCVVHMLGVHQVHSVPLPACPCPPRSRPWPPAQRAFQLPGEAASRVRHVRRARRRQPGPLVHGGPALQGAVCHRAADGGVRPPAQGGV